MRCSFAACGCAADCCAADSSAGERRFVAAMLKENVAAVRDGQMRDGRVRAREVSAMSE